MKEYIKKYIKCTYGMIIFCIGIILIIYITKGVLGYIGDLLIMMGGLIMFQKNISKNKIS